MLLSIILMGRAVFWLLFLVGIGVSLLKIIILSSGHKTSSELEKERRQDRK